MVSKLLTCVFSVAAVLAKLYVDVVGRALVTRLSRAFEQYHVCIHVLGIWVIGIILDK